jgi:2-oxoglutarate dehydrogenase E1 component
VLDDSLVDSSKVKRALLCSGKVYYSLLAGREDRQRDDVAIVRIEQLYPYPLNDTRRILASYPNLDSVVWVQEEPRNMGAWRNLRHRLDASPPKGIPLVFTGRDSRAVPATGAYEIHQLEERELVEAAFADKTEHRVIKRDKVSKTSRKNALSVA